VATRTRSRDPRVIHLHVSKTAGTSLREILCLQYGTGAVHRMGDIDTTGDGRALGPDVMRAIERKSIRAFSGHMAFGLHEYIPGPSTYVTLLRHPIARIRSYYHWVLRHPQSPIRRQLTRAPTFDEFLEHGLVRALVDNGQTRLLGLPLLAWDRPIDRDTLRIAKRNLDAFSVPGLVERFDDSVGMMRRLLGWRVPTGARLNVAPTWEEPPPHTLRTLRRRNQLDLELHAFAAERFSELQSRRGSPAVEPGG
jgi:sulfotransferase famil protein